MTKRVALVGAGLSGLACAARLVTAGHEVVIFEKSRGPSGRMSTRRGDDWQCDHGAQYFTARSPDFQAEVERWVAAGVAAEWKPRLKVFGARADASSGETPPRRWVGTPRMTSPAALLANELDVRLEHTVTALQREDSAWRLVTREHGLSVESFDAVLLSAPSPQAVALLPGSSLKDLAARARMRASWALMVRCAQPLGVRFDAAFINEGPLRWAARDSSKPGRPPGDVWLLHAEAEWSERHLEFAPEQVTELLLTAWEQLVRSEGASLPARETTIHRWRYADTEAPLEQNAAWDAALGLGLCGDWLGSGGVEGAWHSGRALAVRVLGR